jgi:hypothetical protein
MKEEPRESYSVTFKLPLRPLCGVAVTRRKMQLLTSERSFLCGVSVARTTTQQRAQVVVCVIQISIMKTYFVIDTFKTSTILNPFEYYPVLLFSTFQ